jgi:ribose-phosphate pyrophosphokinase
MTAATPTPIATAVAPGSRLPGDVTKRLMFFAGSAHPSLAQRIADELGVSMTPQTAHTFANSETFSCVSTSQSVAATPSSYTPPPRR